MSEGARRVTDWRRRWRWEMAELKDGQLLETEGELQCHSCLTPMERTFAFESLQLERLVCRGLTVVGQPMCFSALWDVTVSQRSPLDEERSRLSSLCLFPSPASPWSLSTPWGANSPLQSVATCNSFSVREESAPRPCGVPVTSFVFAESIKLKLQYFGHLM